MSASQCIYPILDIISDKPGVVISKAGNITIAFAMECPEVYSLYSSDIDIRQSFLYQAFSHLPSGSWVHKQDVFTLQEYKSTSAESFIKNAENRHFHKREYIAHKCILAFSLSSLKSLEAAYNANPFAYKESLHSSDMEALSDFFEAVDAAVNVINNINSTRLVALTGDELKKHISQYINLFPLDGGICDVRIDKEIYVGRTIARCYAITDENLLPDGDISTYIVDDTLPKSNASLFMMPFEKFGVHLHCNHVYNQIIYFEGDYALKEKLDKSVRTHKQNTGFDKAIKERARKLDEMQTEILRENVVLCHAHFSLMIWDEDETKLNRYEKEVKAVYNVRNYSYYIPTFENLANIFAASVIGAAPSLKRTYMFLTTLPTALCLFISYTTFTDDAEGIYFNDRISQIPLKKDIWDADKKRINARNGIVVASTGGGKSFLTQNICQQLIEQNYSAVVCEFGSSFKQLCFLYPSKSLHIDYDGKSPLGINPFDLEGGILDDDKLQTLVGIVQKFWRISDINQSTNQSVSLSRLIVIYYNRETKDYSFPNFYRFLKANFSDICQDEENNINFDFFDIKSFLHVCSEFMPGGRYENICATSSLMTGMKDKSFIVFELTQIKGNAFLTSLVMTILFDVIKHKILSDRSRRGMLIFDEYAETAQMKDATGMDSDIHSTVAFCYQKIRKENGAIMTIIQSPSQLPDNEFTDGIIANTQLLYVLPTNEVVYDATIKTFKIKDEAQINQMKSIRNDFNNKHPYSECWLRFGENYSLVVRLESSLEKFLAFQTEGEIRTKLDKLYKDNGGNMQQAINDYIKTNTQVS